MKPDYDPDIRATIGLIISWVLFLLALAIIAGLVRIASAEARIPTVVVSISGENSLDRDKYTELMKEAAGVWSDYVTIDIKRHIHYKRHLYSDRNSLADREYQLRRWRNYFATRKQFTGMMHLVLAPPLKDSGAYWIGGMTLGNCQYKKRNNVAIAWVETKNHLNQDRWWHSITAISHEIGHQLGATHTLCEDVMDVDAWQFVVPGYWPYICKQTVKSLLWCTCNKNDVRQCK